MVSRFSLHGANGQPEMANFSDAAILARVAGGHPNSVMNPSLIDWPPIVSGTELKYRKDGKAAAQQY